MHMIRCQPHHEMISLRQAMDKLFEDSFVTPHRFHSTLSPRVSCAVNMYQTANEVVVKAAIPGVKPEEVDITITGDILTIKGEAKVEEETKREDYFYQEHRYGAFSRSVTLPSGLDSDKAEASFENGFLTLTIPKSEQVKPKKIKVKPKGAVEGKE